MRVLIVSLVCLGSACTPQERCEQAQATVAASCDSDRWDPPVCAAELEQVRACGCDVAAWVGWWECFADAPVCGTVPEAEGCGTASRDCLAECTSAP